MRCTVIGCPPRSCPTRLSVRHTSSASRRSGARHWPRCRQQPSNTLDRPRSGARAKPIIDIDVVVDGDDLLAAMAALETLGYEHQGDLGVTDREAFRAPDEDPRRHVYVCRRLPSAPFCGRDPDVREEYGAVKTALAADSDMDIETYVARKSAVLQKVLAVSDLTVGPDEVVQLVEASDGRLVAE